MLAIENLHSSLRDQIADRAEGNPFFLEEVIRTLIDTGALTRDPTSGRWWPLRVGRIPRASEMTWAEVL